jgi:TRAP transporter 4TM/12TM fusion protein
MMIGRETFMVRDSNKIMHSSAIFDSVIRSFNTKPSTLYGLSLSIFAMAITGYHIWVGWHGPLESMVNRSVHVSLFMALVFLYPSFHSLKAGKRLLGVCFENIVPGILVLVMGAYYVVNIETLDTRMVDPTNVDLVFGFLTILIVIEAGRRSIGYSLPLLVIFLILYAVYGPYFPAPFDHRGFTLSYVISQLYLTSTGLFGILVFIMSTYIFLFLIFGTFLQESGGGKFFMDAATALTGHMTGGPAKTAVVGSAFFGSLSGSSVANVVTTGSFTIPTMINMGYSPRLAGAIEAVASTGGQLMPPVMGACAFIMAEIIGVPYITICKIAVIPAILYFFAAGIFIHFESKKNGLVGLPRDQIPRLTTVLRNQGLFVFPLFLILGLLIYGASPMKVGFYAIVSIFAILVIYRRKNLKESSMSFISAFETAATNAMPVAAVVACAGMVISLIMVSGIGPKISSILVTLSGGSLFLLLLFSMIASIILGMGMTTIGVYIILAITVIPTLINMGIHPYAAHLFAFYFGSISYITPPVAIASIAAAGISGDNPMGTGYAAFRIALLAFIVPFIFVYKPSLIMVGNPLEIFATVATSVIGVVGFCAGMVGYVKRRIGWIKRACLVLGGLLLIIPGTVTDLVGFFILLSVWIHEYGDEFKKYHFVLNKRKED